MKNKEIEFLEEVEKRLKGIKSEISELRKLVIWKINEIFNKENSK